MMMPADDKKFRCFGAKPGQTLYAQYHDTQWGVPVHDDTVHFEMLILEGAQAGLNWETILKKREGYRRVFKQFNVNAVAKMSDNALDRLRQDDRIIRNRLKIASARKNARVFLELQKEYGSFDQYVWRYVHGTPIINHWQTAADVPSQTPESEALSKDLKKRGMSFVGPTIMYAYMQAVGMVFDHLTNCWIYQRRFSNIG